MAQFLDQIACGNVLGEGVLWQASTQSIWWTDIETSCLYQANWPFEDENPRCFPTPKRLASFAFTDSTDTLMCAFENGFALFRPADQTIHWLAHVDITGTRLNDGRVDPMGRFWSASMVEDRAAGSNGRLFCLDPETGIETHDTDLLIGNGICWSPDGSTQYWSDSARHVIYAASFNSMGVLGDKQVFVRLEPPAVPDGAVTDKNGNLWSALWAAHAVGCFAPCGKEIMRIDLPCQQPTCVCFGGADMDILFISSAKKGLSAANSQDGNLFAYKVDTQGLPGKNAKIEEFFPLQHKGNTAPLRGIDR